jgi:hypothetical protein
MSRSLRTTSRCAERHCSLPSKPAVCRRSIDAPLAIGLDEQEQSGLPLPRCMDTSSQRGAAAFCERSRGPEGCRTAVRVPERMEVELTRLCRAAHGRVTSMDRCGVACRRPPRESTLSLYRSEDNGTSLRGGTAIHDPLRPKLAALGLAQLAAYESLVGLDFAGQRLLIVLRDEDVPDSVQHPPSRLVVAAVRAPPALTRSHSASWTGGT